MSALELLERLLKRQALRIRAQGYSHNERSIHCPNCGKPFHDYETRKNLPIDSAQRLLCKHCERPFMVLVGLVYSTTKTDEVKK